MDGGQVPDTALIQSQTLSNVSFKFHTMRMRGHVLIVVFCTYGPTDLLYHYVSPLWGPVHQASGSPSLSSQRRLPASTVYSDVEAVV